MNITIKSFDYHSEEENLMRMEFSSVKEAIAYLNKMNGSNEGFFKVLGNGEYEVLDEYDESRYTVKAKMSQDEETEVIIDYVEQYDIVFHDETSCNSEGFHQPYDYCVDYIKHGLATMEDYFGSYQGGMVCITTTDQDDAEDVYCVDIPNKENN